MTRFDLPCPSPSPCPMVASLSLSGSLSNARPPRPFGPWQRDLGPSALREQALVDPSDLVRYAPTARGRAVPLSSRASDLSRRRRQAEPKASGGIPENDGAHPLRPFSSRRFRTWMPRFARRLRRDDHEIYPSSPLSLIAAPGPFSARHEISASLRFREARSRRWKPEIGVAPADFARPLSLSGFCCGPRSAAIWRPQADAISRRLAALATKPFTPADADGRSRQGCGFVSTPRRGAA
jgi:hypothetical protein